MALGSLRHWNAQAKTWISRSLKESLDGMVACRLSVFEELWSIERSCYGNVDNDEG